MKLRRRLVATMIVLVAVGLAAVDAITLSSLRAYLYGRADAQLTTASGLVAHYVLRAQDRGFPVTAASIRSRVSPDIYVELINAQGKVVVSRPSGSRLHEEDPAPRLPVPLPVVPSAGGSNGASDPGASDPGASDPDGAYRPSSVSVNVSSEVHDGPTYRLQASSLSGRTLVVATRLDSINATLASLRTIDMAVSIGLLAFLLASITLLIRLGLRPLEDMTKEADAIAAGDLTRRVRPTEGTSEIARLGRALNGMLSQIETAFAQRTRSEDRLRSFLADASHELRTPLTAIRGYAELLQKEAFGNKASRDRALSRIEKEAARMGDLVGDLAILAREGEGPEPARHRVDLAAVATEAVADVQTVDASGRIGLRAPGEVPVAGDEARLGQMVHNLLANAVRHTPAGTPIEVEVEVEAEVESREGSAVLRVRDHGQGMTAEQASHVFDRFYRGDVDRLDGGSGLGLSIVASLARTFGGRASVETAEGEGATFEVRLPLYRSGGAALDSRTGEPLAPEMAGSAAGAAGAASGSTGAGPSTELLPAGRRRPATEPPPAKLPQPATESAVADLDGRRPR